MSELNKKGSKEEYGSSVRKKLFAIGNVFMTKREVSSHKAIKRILSFHLRYSKIKCKYVCSKNKKYRTRMVKSADLLSTMYPDDTNVYINLYNKHI